MSPESMKKTIKPERNQTVQSMTISRKKEPTDSVPMTISGSGKKTIRATGKPLMKSGSTEMKDSAR